MPATAPSDSRPPDLDTLARELAAAQDTGQQLPTLTSRWPGLGLADGYAIAHRIHAARLARGARRAGRKIGFTNREMWARYGVREPVWGYVYDSTLRSLAAAGDTCSLEAYAEPRIEPEMVLHFRAAPPVGATLAEVLACVDWVAHGFEIVQSHYPEWRFAAADAVADGGLHGELLVGEPIPVADLGPDPVATLARFQLALYCDGRLVERGAGANALDNPLAAVAHLVGVLASQPFAPPLEAGETVTTGTLTLAHPIRPGEQWSTRVEGIPGAGLAVRFV